MRQTAKRALLERVFLAVVGPTASGKSDLALALAKELGGEVISADSRQIYKGISAGTAKPSIDSRGCVEGIAYHLVDFLDPTQSYDAGSFAAQAQTLLSEIKNRDHIPIVAGGTGLYLEALEGGLSPLPKGNPILRQELMLEAEKKGRKALYDELKKIDPEAGLKIPQNNIHRVIRALEVFRLTGRTISDYWKERGSFDEGKYVHLRIEWPIDSFRIRVKDRARKMWPGILTEVKRLVPQFYSGKEPAFQSLGYPQALQYIRGEISAQTGLEELISETLAYAKRQRTWFRHRLKSPVIEIMGDSTHGMLSQSLKALSLLSPNA